jgi:hypothetical protein
MILILNLIEWINIETSWTNFLSSSNLKLKYVKVIWCNPINLTGLEKKNQVNILLFFDIEQITYWIYLDLNVNMIFMKFIFYNLFIYLFKSFKFKIEIDNKIQSKLLKSWNNL